MEKSDVDFILSNLWKCVLPDEHCALQLLKMGADVMSQEPNVLDLKTPITVCGDLHGQFYDVLELFSVGGKPPEQNFIFLGDYVDRGYYSTETLFLLLCLKVRFPTKIYLLRGNHETQAITEQYGFYEEVRKKYPSSDIYNKCLEVFQMMPLAALIDNKVFCIHGGLSPSLTDIKEIEEEKAKQEKLIAEKVNYELDLIGIASHLQGRKYLFDAITYLLSEEGENSQGSINQYLLSKHKRPTSTINRAMQNAIVRAWRVTAIEDLEKLYTAHINYNTGVPTHVEFIYYYVEKIKKEI